MAYEPVDLFVSRDDASGTPVEGVVVQVYDAAGARLFSKAVTDGTGKASFLMPGDTEFSARFYKFGVSFAQPQQLHVITNPATPGSTPNVFDVLAYIPQRPESPDVRLCRVSGVVRDVTGAPQGGLSVSFVNTFRPVHLDGALVMDGSHTVRSSADGHLCVDLIRCAEYTANIESFEGESRHVRVPNLPSANIADVLFPVVARVNVVVPPLSLVADTVVSPVVHDSAGAVLPGTAHGDVHWYVDDPTVASLVVNADTLGFRGLRRGVTSLRAERKDSSIVRIPDTPIQGMPVTLSVT